jgi:hypothetical protein
MDIGRPQRIIEIEPISLPVPSAEPLPIPEPHEDPAPAPSEPLEP